MCVQEDPSIRRDRRIQFKGGGKLLLREKGSDSMKVDASPCYAPTTQEIHGAALFVLQCIYDAQCTSRRSLAAPRQPSLDGGLTAWLQMVHVVGVVVSSRAWLTERLSMKRGTLCSDSLLLEEN